MKHTQSPYKNCKFHLELSMINLNLFTCINIPWHMWSTYLHSKGSKEKKLFINLFVCLKLTNILTRWYFSLANISILTNIRTSLLQNSTKWYICFHAFRTNIFLHVKQLFGCFTCSLTVKVVQLKIRFSFILWWKLNRLRGVFFFKCLKLEEICVNKKLSVILNKTSN